MLLDARRIDDGSELAADVCVVGGGAAGITIARELSRSSSLEVMLLESGGLQFDAGTQALYEGESAGRDREYFDLDACRLRYFGGTTNHWAGWCRPLDELDFDEREGIPHSGWPLRRADLDPFYRDAVPICQLPTSTFEAGDWARMTGTRPVPPTRDVGSAVFQVSPPTRFGEAYRPELERSRTVRVLLHANVVRVQLAEGGQVVRSARVATLSGTGFSVRARLFVLATGAVENARLLLASNDVRREGIGNEHDLVGRFFADHPHVLVGAIQFPRKSRSFYAQHPSTGRPRAEGVLVTSDRFTRSEHLLRCCLVRVPPPPQPIPLGTQIRAAARDLTGTDLGLLRALQVRVEQAPNPDSRVLLTRERDALGMPRVKLDWRLTQLERRTASRSLQVLSAAVGAAGAGRVFDRTQVDPDLMWFQAHGGSHHMGTVRMARDARHGVVDANCRVHSVSNLYVAGSAVFPTTGYANPTFTIVALALRLAAHLRREPA